MGWRSHSSGPPPFAVSALHCPLLPAGARRSPALDSNSVAPGSRPRRWWRAAGVRGVRAGGARTDLGVRTLGSRPQAPAGCSRRRTPASASNAPASQARWASEGAPEGANPLPDPNSPTLAGSWVPLCPGVPGRRGVPCSAPKSAAWRKKGRPGGVPAASPAALAYLCGELRSRGSAARRPAGLSGWWARAVRGCQSAVVAPKARELSGAALAGPPTGPARAPQTGLRRPAAFPEGPIPSRGWPGGGGRGGRKNTRTGPGPRRPVSMAAGRRG